MSSEDEFDDLQLNLSVEELEELDIRTAEALSALATQPTLLPGSKVSASNTACTQSSGTSASTTVPPVEPITSPHSPSEDSFADESFEDPEFLKALDVAMTQTEHLYAANSGPPGPSRLPEHSGNVGSQGLTKLVFSSLNCL